MSRLVIRIPSWLPRGNVSVDHAYEVATGFERLFGVVARDETGVIIEGHVSLSPETVEDSQQSSVFLVNAGPDELDTRYDAQVGFSRESRG